MKRQKFVDEATKQLVNFEVKFGMNKEFSDRKTLIYLVSIMKRYELLTDLHLQDDLFKIDNVGNELYFRGIKVRFLDSLHDKQEDNITLVKDFSKYGTN